MLVNLLVIAACSASTVLRMKVAWCGIRSSSLLVGRLRHERASSRQHHGPTYNPTGRDGNAFTSFSKLGTGRDWLF